MIEGNDNEFVEVFTNEIKGYITVLEDNALLLEKNPNQQNALTEIKRVLHSIKGIVGIIGEHYADLRVITFQLEELFTKGEITVTSLELLLEYVDDLKKFVQRVFVSNSLEIPYNDLFLNVKKKIAPEVILEQPYEIKVIFSPKSSLKSARMLALINRLKRVATIEVTRPTSDELLEGVDFEFGLLRVRSRESRHKLSDVISRVPDVESFSILEVQPEQGQKIIDKEKALPWAENKIEVSLDKLERIIALLEDLVVAGNVIEHLDLSSLSSGEIEVLSGFVQNVLGIQELIFEIRRVPINIILGKIPRLARDVAKTLGKSVQVHLLGSHIGVDRVLVESLADPLTVLVQNAVIHGIETPKERVKKGKGEIGTITVSVELSEGETIIKVSDDGAGINGEKIWEKAKKQGIVAPNEEYSLEKALDLVFSPSISSQDEASIMAGRGMGLYSVKETVQAFEGEIRVETMKDKGTTFTLVFPTKKPIIPVIIARIGDLTFGFPQVNVSHIQRIQVRTEAISFQEAVMSDTFVLETLNGNIKVINLLRRLMNVKQRSLLAVTSTDPNQELSSLVMESIQDQGLAVIHWTGEHEEIGFLINTVLDIRELAINYDDPITHVFPYVQGSARIESNKGLLILNPKRFAEELS